MDCFGAYFTHARSCDNVRVHSATEWTASVHTLRMPKAVITFVFNTLHMPKAVITFVFIVLRNGLLLPADPRLCITSARSWIYAGSTHPLSLLWQTCYPYWTCAGPRSASSLADAPCRTQAHHSMFDSDGDISQATRPLEVL